MAFGLRATVVAALAASAISLAMGPVALSGQRIPEPFSLTSEDGFRIEAIYYGPSESSSERSPAIVLLPGGGQPKEIWANTGILDLLGQDSSHLLTLNVRGQGNSQERPTTMNPGLGVLDVEAALAWLSDRDDVDTTRIVLIGASYGANLAYAGIQTRGWLVRGMVALSATAAGYRWFPESEYIHPIPRGLFLHASDELPRYQTAATLERLIAATSGNVVSATLKGATHAQGLYRFPEVAPMVRAWLEGVVD